MKLALSQTTHKTCQECQANGVSLNLHLTVHLYKFSNQENDLGCLGVKCSRVLE